MSRILNYLLTGFGLVVVGISGYAAYATYKSKQETDKSIPNEPFAAGAIDIERDTGTNTGGIYSQGGALNPTQTGADTVSPETTVGTQQVLTIPLDRTSEFAARLTPDVKEVKLTSPLVYVKDDGTAILDAVQELVVNRTTPEGVQQSVVYVDKDGERYASEQDLFNAFIRKSSQAGIDALQRGTAISTLDAIKQGLPINVTNVMTSLPKEFPRAKEDAISAEFQKRARALQATLTVENPGASSASGIANFSRLAALGADLSNVDLYNVRNPNFIGKIKGKPLTREQQIMLDQLRLKIDPRNETSSDIAERRARQELNALQQAQLKKRAQELVQQGYSESKGKNYLATQGIKVTGTLSPAQFAALEARLGPGATKACLTCTATEKTISTEATSIGKSAQRKLEIFKKQTGRKDLNNLTPAEQFALQRLLSS